MIVEMMDSANLGILASTAEIVMKLVHAVYIDGAHWLGEARANNTSKNLPKPPAGDRMAATRPPMSFPLPSPASQEGTWYAVAVNAAPSRCAGI